MAEPATIHELAEELYRKSSSDKGIWYELTEKNVFSAGDLFVTPADMWDRPAAAIGPRHARDLVDAIYAVIASARSLVDIASLGDNAFPDLEFEAAIRGGLQSLAASGRAVTVRIAFGQPGLYAKNLDTLRFLEGITKGITPGGSAKLKVYVAQVVSKVEVGIRYSWNHAKIVAADGGVAIVGGHNLYGAAYLDATRPIFDLSMRVQGPAAGSAQKFCSRLWRYIAEFNNHDGVSKTYSNNFDAATGSYGKLAPEPVGFATADGHGDVPILAVAESGYGAYSEMTASSQAVLYFVSRATKSVYLSQQDLVSGTLDKGAGVWSELFEELARFVVQRKGRLGIVISGRDATDSAGAKYSHGYAPEEILSQLEKSAKAIGLPGGTDLEDALQRRVFIGSIRFSHADRGWPDTKPIGNHAKFWMVDERVFYVGSDNLYPNTSDKVMSWVRGALQEYGFIVEHAPSAAHVLASYWRPLIEFSLNSAISGLDWGVGPERLVWRKRPVDAPPPDRRLGPRLDDPRDAARKFLFSLSGSGELVTRTYDAASRHWHVEDVAKPTRGSATIVGPAVPEKHAVMIATREGELFQRWWNAAESRWEWLEHHRPGALAVTALGPLWQHPGQDDAYRFFAVVNGTLYDRYWRVSDGYWHWQQHDSGGWRVAAIGPLLFDPNGPVPFRLFVLGEDGTVRQTMWNPTSSPHWQWLRHDRDDAIRIGELGPMIADRGTEHPVKVYARGDSGQLFELVYIPGAAERKWVWWQYAQPHQLIALGPAFLSHHYGNRLAKKFVLASDGALWEHFWSQRDRAWQWKSHGTPGGDLRFVGIGPRPAVVATADDPRVFVTTQDGRFFERRWRRRDGEWISLTQWDRNELPHRSQRFGELVEPGIGGKPTLYHLSGHGHLAARTLDPGGWRIEHEALPFEDEPATVIGPALGAAKDAPQIVFLNTAAQPAIARWDASAKAWVCERFSLPDGSRVAAFGPLLNDPTYPHPYRAFVATEKGNLYDAWTDKAMKVWTWQAHGQPDAGRVRTIGGVLLNLGGPRIRLFVSCWNGALYERYYDGQWRWTHHPLPGAYVASVGPLLSVRNIIRQFVLLATGELASRDWLGGPQWTWAHHGTPAVPIAALGPAFVSGNGWLRVFVRTVAAEMVEWSFDPSKTEPEWVSHGLPGPGKPQRVAAIGPRAVGQQTIRVFVASESGKMYERRLNGSVWEWYDV